MNERKDSTMDALTARVRTIFTEVGRAVNEHDLEGLKAGTEQLHQATYAWHLSRRLKAVVIVRDTMDFLAGAYPAEGWPGFAEMLGQLRMNLNASVVAEDIEKIDHYLADFISFPLPLKTQDRRVHNTRRPDSNILGLGPEVRALIEGGRTEPAGETDEENRHG